MVGQERRRIGKNHRNDGKTSSLVKNFVSIHVAPAPQNMSMFYLSGDDQLREERAKYCEKGSSISLALTLGVRYMC
jgi:hypothetical protein